MTTLILIETGLQQQSPPQKRGGLAEYTTRCSESLVPSSPNMARVADGARTRNHLIHSQVLYH